MSSKRVPSPYAGPVTYGIDISKWNGEVDLSKIPKDSFVICRTGDGKDVDPLFKKNWIGCGEYGLIRGSYHYFRADRDGKFQAELVCKTIEDTGDYIRSGVDIPPCLDLEGGARKNLPGGVLGGTADLPIDLVAEEALEFLTTLEAELGCLPLVYTGQAFHWWLSQARPDLAIDFAKYPLWVPSYTKVPQIPADIDGDPFPWQGWCIWQYTASARVPGVTGDVDRNVFQGDLGLLKSWIYALWTRGEYSPVELKPINEEITATIFSPQDADSLKKSFLEIQTLLKKYGIVE